jgi:hypothetical protein
MTNEIKEIIVKWFKGYASKAEGLLEEMKQHSPSKAAETVFLAEIIVGNSEKRITDAALVSDVLSITEPTWEELGL